MHNLKLPPGMLALSTGPDGGELEERPAHGYRFPADYEALDEGPFADYSDAVNFRANGLHPDLERTSMIVGDRGRTYSIHVPRALRQQIAGRGQADVMNPTHAAQAPGEPTGGDRPMQSYLHSYAIPWTENPETRNNGFFSRASAEEFVSSLHPSLRRAGSYSVEQHQGNYHVFHPQHVVRDLVTLAGSPLVQPPHAPAAPPAEPDYYDPAYPKVQVWHNDIAYTAPRHPDAVSDEHAKAMAELEVHRRHTAKLRKQLADFPENASNNPEESERFSQLENRVGDAEGHLRQLRLIEGAHRTLAAGLTNPGYRLKKGTIYLGADRYMRMDPEQAFTSVADAMGAGNAKQHITKIPGVWMIVDRRGDVMRHALRNNTDAQGWNNTKEGFVAQNPQWFMTPRLPSDMSKLPIAAWGKTRKKTGEWFSNLPPGMQAPPLELAGSDPVEQEPWKIQNTTGEPWNMRAEPWKVKEVRIGDGPDDTLHYLAAPRTPPEFTPELEAIRNEHGLDVPHSLTVLRGRRMRYNITGEGKAPQFLSHGHHTIRELLAEHRPVSLSFSAEEPKRQRLYYRLMQNLAKDPVASKQYKFYGAPDHYYFHIVHNSVAGMAPMYHKMSTMEITPGEHASVLPPGMRGQGSLEPGKSVATSNLPPGMIALAGTHIGAKHPGDMDLSEFLPASKYDAAIRSNYFDGPAHIHSSRETPATNQIHVPIGTWRIDDTFPGIYGHTIDQLRELDPHTLHLPEGDYTKEGYNPEGRGWDAQRYAQWMKAGHQPPPIEVMQYGGDTWLPEGAPQLGVINGHRRTAAAKMAGKKILAWVSPTVKSGRTDYAGRPMTTGLTWELAKHHRGTLTPEELEKLPELKQAIAGLPQDPDSIVFANEQQSQRFERLHANPYEEAPDPSADPSHPRYGPGGAYEGQIPWTEPEIDPETGNLLWPQEEHAAAAVVLPHLRGGKPLTARQLATKHGIPGLPSGMKALKAEG